MKMHLSVILLAMSALLVVSAAHAQRSPVPIVDRPVVPAISGSGKPLSGEALSRAIINGGAAGARKWSFVAGANGTLRGTYRVRSHTVEVDVVPGQGAYSLKYAGSVNMKYGIEGGTPVIHPFYNRWVDELIESIRVEISKL